MLLDMELSPFALYEIAMRPIPTWQVRNLRQSVNRSATGAVVVVFMNKRKKDRKTSNDTVLRSCKSAYSVGCESLAFLNRVVNRRGIRSF